MRNHLALAFVLAAAAVPAHAQRPQPVYHGNGYDIALPGRCTPAGTKSGIEARYRTEMSMFDCGGTLVLVGHFSWREIEDTTLTTRRAMLQLVQSGMLHSSSAEVTVVGQPLEFERADRVGTRLSVSMVPERNRDETFYGTAEVSVARGGGLELWMVLFMGPKHDAATGAAAERVLDSFHLTGAPPVVAESDAGKAPPHGFIEAPKDNDSAEKPGG